MEDSQREAIISAVEARMQTFEAVERDIDPEQTIAILADLPEFHAYNDGRRVSYPEMVAAVRGGFPRLRSIKMEYDNLHVAVLNADHALVSATFRRESVLESTGMVNRSKGAVTWLWRNIEGQWLIVYGQLDHRADAGS